MLGMVFAIVGAQFLICIPGFIAVAFIRPTRPAGANWSCGLYWPLLGVSFDMAEGRDSRWGG
ncbi:hypothetical protein B0O80DRAFT_456372 [Mortierella sp. GBAus27b]|nr:hypothetical protein B0O80DRAFT_456372 [Mortierella sp. GBAus27b]